MARAHTQLHPCARVHTATCLTPARVHMASPLRAHTHSFTPARAQCTEATLSLHTAQECHNSAFNAFLERNTKGAKMLSDKIGQSWDFF